MKKGRFSLILAWAILLDCLMLGTAFAAFGFGGGDEGKSGLDFDGGYDVNTVTTVSGKVISLPRQGDRKYTIIGISSREEKYYLYVGPSSYWEKNGIPVRVNDVISAKGSTAQGADGKTYLITQKLTNRTTGERLELRNEEGEAMWAGGSRNTLRHGGFGANGGMGHMGRGMRGMGRGMR